MADELVEWLLGSSTVPLTKLCNGVVCRAAERLQLEGGTERLDHAAMTRDLRTLCLVLNVEESKVEEDVTYGEDALDLLQRVCLPYLDVLFKDCTARLESIEIVAETLSRVLQYPHLPAEVAVSVLRDGVCQLLLTERAEEDSTERLPALASFLCALFSSSPPDNLHHIAGCAAELDNMFPLLLSLLNHAPASTCYQLLSSPLPSFITPSHPHLLPQVWDMLQDVWHGRRLVELHPLVFSLALLCCFADVLIARDHTSPFIGAFPSAVSDLCPLLDVRAESVLWVVLGAGLRSSDPLDRKRSMYLLDRVLLSVRSGGGDVMSEGGVFWWRRECEGVLSAVWDDLVLLLHTMEEKQVHIVKPVKSRMKNIVQATTTFIEGCGVLHVSWLELALERIFVHSEAKSIVRWGVSETLSLDLASSPLLLPPHWQFVYGPLLIALSDTKLYTKDPASGPPVASLLTAFLQNWLTHLPQPLRAEFIHGLLVALEAANMSEAPLLHVTHSLSLLSPVPLLTPSSLLVLRSIISQLDNHRVLPTAAVGTFLLTTAANLSDLSGVGYYEVAILLRSARVSDCLVFSSALWRKMCVWLTDVCALSQSPLSMFLADSLSSLLNPDSQAVGHSPLSLLLLLSVDAQLTGLHCLPESPPLDQLLSSLLQPVMSVLSSASSRPYLSSHTLTSSLLTLTSLLTTFLSGRLLSDTWKGEDSETGRLLFKCLLPWLPDVIQSLQELLLKGSKDGVSISLAHITLLTSSLSSIYTFTTLYGFSWSSNLSPTHLASAALCTLDSALQTNTVVVLTPAVMGALGAVGWVCEESLTLPPSVLSSLFHLPLSLPLTRPSAGVEVVQECVSGRMEWGPIMEWCEAIHWTTIRYCQQILYSGQHDDVERGGVRTGAAAVWQVCLESVSSVSSSQLPCVLDCMALLLPHVDLSLVPETVHRIWSSVRLSLSALPAFLRLLLHPHLLVSTDIAAVELVEELCEELMALGERRSGVANALVAGLCEGWGGEWGRVGGERVVESMLRHSTLILQLCCFGSVSRKSIRSLVDSEQFVRLLGDQVAANCIAASAASELQGDSGVRVMILSFLVGVASSKISTHFLSEFTSAIMQKLSDLSARYFINSLTHRRKQRLLQTLLLLLPHLTPEEEEGLAREILQALQCDNQTSVRHLLEWTAVVLMARHRTLISSLLLPALHPESDFRLSRLPSLFAVTVHLSGTGSHTERLHYCHTVLPLMFQWTTCHHFVVRLYAQRTVEVLWEVGKEEWREDHTLINNCISFLKRHSDAARSPHKLDKNIFFSHIQPLSDLSVEALLDYLPRVCGMVESECVSASDCCDIWERWGVLGGDNGTRVPLYCDNDMLRDIVKSGGVRDEGVRGDDSRSIGHKLVEVTEPGTVASGGVGGERDGDMQKKITRWSSGGGVMAELFPGLSQDTQRQPTGGLILVASLLNKIPNLGGLCRTCEIFGVSELIVPSKSATEDPQFTALSVSSQHWVKISEVRLPQLPSYLLSMRSAGYQLVGAEQTAQSKSVLSYTFQPLTVLLLGNEREGIPVQLLHMLHECVEIPQLGLVRSLNVHVSGALLVWEYCKQHLLTEHSRHS